MSENEPPREKTFLEDVISRLFETSPAALLASGLQFLIFAGLIASATTVCSWKLSWLQTACSSSYLEQAAQVFPPLTFWLIVAVIFCLIPFVVFLWPAAALFGVLYVAQSLPSGIGQIAWIAGLAGIVFVFYLIARLFGGGGGGGLGGPHLR
jgi:hypothetical protein